MYDYARLDAIEVIDNYIHEVLPQTVIWKEVSSEEESYKKWAANEAVRVLSSSQQPPLYLLEQLRDRFELYASKNRQYELIFTCAYEAINDILALLID